MAHRPKLRIFAGPNGSGKTTLFKSIKSIYFSTKLFINADYLEEAYKKNNFINLSEFDICCNEEVFCKFYLASGLYKKANFNLGHDIMPDIPFTNVKYAIEVVKEFRY